MIYQSISKKYFAWLYNHAGKFKKTILIILLLNILAVTFSLLFVEVTKIFMEGVEKGEDFSFLLLAVYGKNLVLGVAVLILGIGHIGIHLMHKREI